MRWCSQFTILRSWALLLLASGYLFTAVIVIPWLLTFPGVFAPNGLLVAGLQSTSWSGSSIRCSPPRRAAWAWA
ncbi:MAG TPA: MASE4 domain-containing protein [Devosiaceae bacterium]|nr:MASE4 domain-containing protein [Devosiaceae bacterium]